MLSIVRESRYGASRVINCLIEFEYERLAYIAKCIWRNQKGRNRKGSHSISEDPTKAKKARLENIARLELCRQGISDFLEKQAILPQNLEGSTRGEEVAAQTGLGREQLASEWELGCKDFCCPLSKDIMYDPVRICTGKVYERKNIER